MKYKVIHPDSSLGVVGTNLDDKDLEGHDIESLKRAGVIDDANAKHPPTPVESE